MSRVDEDPLESISEAVDLASGGLERRLPHVMRTALTAVMRDAARTFEPFGLRPSQFAALLVVRDYPGLKQQEVGELIGMRHSNLVGIIDALEERGLVQRVRVPKDRRSYAIRMTKAGEKLVADMRRAEDEHHRKLVELLGEKRFVQVLDAMSELSKLA